MSPDTLRMALNDLWRPKRSNCTQATPNAADFGASFCRSAKTRSSGCTAGSTCNSTIRWAKVSTKIGLARWSTNCCKAGIARPSDGAVCIFIEGQKVPMIVRKKDGAFLYGTTDLATIRYRMETWRPDAILYVVDHRQSFAFSAAFRRRPTAGLQGRRIAARQFRHGVGRRRPAVQDALGRHRRPGRLVGRIRSPSRRDCGRRRRRQARWARAFGRNGVAKSPRRWASPR